MRVDRLQYLWQNAQDKTNAIIQLLLDNKVNEDIIYKAMQIATMRDGE